MTTPGVPFSTVGGRVNNRIFTRDEINAARADEAIRFVGENGRLIGEEGSNDPRRNE